MNITDVSRTIFQPSGAFFSSPTPTPTPTPIPTIRTSTAFSDVYFALDCWSDEYWGVVPEAVSRRRLGDLLDLYYATPQIPTAAPSAAVAGPVPSAASVATVPLWTHDGGGSFRGSILLGPQFGLGTYTVTAIFVTATGTSQDHRQIAVVAGGDPAGAIIGIYEHEGVPNRSVVVQTASGQLLQGANPWV